MEYSKFGKYHVVEKIGEGGFGEVFKGRDPTLKRFVAIKTCKAASREFLDRFLLEAEISARLQHPNIVTIYDFGYHDETPYLVQEYLAGEDLDRKIRRRAEMDVATRIDILRHAAIGLRHAHHRGIVHRDVKPANLRVLDDGRVKIMDFGIAKLLSAEVELTQTGMTLGTARYQAPEQFRGDKIDLRADIFSFGVTAYELFTYERPFDGDSVARIFYRITHEEPRPILELWPECPTSLEHCVANCLRKDPAHRYSDLAPVINVLEAYGATASSASFSTTAAAAVSRGLPPPLPPPAGASTPTGSVALEEQAESSEVGVISRAYDTAVSLQRSPAVRIGAFAAVALVAFGLTYAAGKLWQGGKQPVDRAADVGASTATATPAGGTQGADVLADSVITVPAAAVRKPLAVGTDDAAAVADGGAAAPQPTETSSAPPSTPTTPPPASMRTPSPPASPPASSPMPSEPDAEADAPPPPLSPPPPPHTPPPTATTTELDPAPVAAPTSPPASPLATPPLPSPPPAPGQEPAAITPPSSPATVQEVTSAGDRSGVVLYEHGDFQGPSEVFYSDDPDLVDNRIGSDNASSVRVPPGCRARLFRKAGYRGKATVLTGDIASLRDSEVGNDEVSSIQVQCSPLQR